MNRYAALVLLVGFLYCKPSKAQNPQTTEGTKATHTDERGTEKSPLVVSTRSVKSDAETAEEERKDAEQENTDKWIIRLTFAIVICAFLQFCAIVGQIIVYRGQSRMMLAGLKIGHKNAQAAIAAANATKESVDALVNKDRGRIFVEVAPFDIKEVGLGTQIVHFKIIYYGATISIHENSRATLEMTSSEAPSGVSPYPLLASRGIHGLPQVIPASSGPYPCVALLFSVFDQYEIDRIAHKERFVHFFGHVAYKDFMGKERLTAFCHTWEIETGILGSNHWRISGGPEANQET